MELGIGADDASAAAAAISSGILNEGHEDGQQDTKRKISNGSASEAQSASDNVSLLFAPESAMFETRLHLAFSFYTTPWLDKVNLVRAPFTDVLELIGGRFFQVKHAVVRFEFSPPATKESTRILTEKLDVRSPFRVRRMSVVGISGHGGR